MNSKRARENGGDEVAVSWAGGVFKDEFDAGLVKGGVRTSPQPTEIIALVIREKEKRKKFFEFPLIR